MIGKISIVILLLTVIGFLGYYFYESIPGNPISLSPVSSSVRDEDYIGKSIGYGNTPVFMEKLRFNKNKISYYIEQSCSEARRKKMVEAFNIFQQEMGIISFYEENYQNADILVGCSNDYISLGEHLFEAGEGGPSQIINTSNFKIIKNGKISLYKKSDCKFPVVELHELSHVFGFDHTNNPKSIMYSISNCDQRLTTDMIDIMKKLYTIEILPDLEISELKAVKKGRYLDFNITVTNVGLKNTEKVTLTIFADGQQFQDINLKEIGIGFGRILSASNIKMPIREPKEVKFYVDYDNTIKELNEDNNFLTLTQSQ